MMTNFPKPNTQKVNYQLILDKILEGIDGEKHLLLHSCCAPCSTYVIKYLSEYFHITVLYYNPNIEPYEEYEKRKNEEIRFIKLFKTKYPVDMVDIDYDNERFHEFVRGLENEPEGGSRCPKCFLLRMEQTAVLAKEHNYDYFCTTLSVSPHKDSQIINRIGAFLEDKYNMPYLFSDFKKRNGYKTSVEMSNEYEIYRQNYCGCCFCLSCQYKDTDTASAT